MLVITTFNDALFLSENGPFDLSMLYFWWFAWVDLIMVFLKV